MRIFLLAVLASLVAAPAARAGDVVHEAAVQAGYGDIADRLAEAARPTMFLRPTRTGSMPSALGTSRLGGDPDLPANVAWPRCKGRPQSFIAQVRVRDLPAGARELRRFGGVLLFFTAVELDEGDPEYPMWAGDCSAVLHVRSGAALKRTKAPTTRMFGLKPVSVRFAERPDVPDLMLDGENLMPPLQDIVPAGGWEQWFHFREALHRKPFVETKLLGYPVAPNGGDECWGRAERGKDTWRHLFTIGPDDEFGFQVADAGRLQLLISPADLRAGRLDRVCGVFDSA
jgi:hypothetical protein